MRPRGELRLVGYEAPPPVEHTELADDYYESSASSVSASSP
jgi:hypothetical protein